MRTASFLTSNLWTSCMFDEVNPLLPLAMLCFCSETQLLSETPFLQFSLKFPPAISPSLLVYYQQFINILQSL